ncbi:MAG: polysaccharide deacetylase family protein [Candidatus Zixiibacteriota bacterium]
MNRQFFVKIFASAAYYLRLWPLLYALYPVFRRKRLLIVMTFHRIVPQSKTTVFMTNYDRGMDSVQYESLLRQLKRYFDFISLDDFIRYVKGEVKPAKHCALLTFDDADHDLVEFAVPILVQNNWPAVIFAPTAYIGTDNRFWHLKLTDMMSKIDDSQWQNLQSNKQVFPAELRFVLDKHKTFDESARQSIGREVIYSMSGLPDDKINEVVEKLLTIVEVQYSLDVRCMDWPQLGELEKNGVSIESHTVSHRKLEFLSDKEAFSELTDSRFAIEGNLKKTVRAFCYPAGSYNERTPKLVCEAGYDVAFTSRFGKIHYPLKDLGLFKLPRMSLSGNKRANIDFEIGKLLFRG